MMTVWGSVMSFETKNLSMFVIKEDIQFAMTETICYRFWRL